MESAAESNARSSAVSSAGSDAESASRVTLATARSSGVHARESLVEETCSSIEPPSDVDTDLGPQEDPAEEREEEEEEDEDLEKSE